MAKHQTHEYDRFPELTALNRLRLEEGLTYRQLEKLTNVSYRTLHGLLNSSNPRPYDRTLFKIRGFLARATNVATKRGRHRSSNATRESTALAI